MITLTMDTENTTCSGKDKSHLHIKKEEDCIAEMAIIIAMADVVIGEETIMEIAIILAEKRTAHIAIHNGELHPVNEAPYSIDE